MTDTAKRLRLVLGGFADKSLGNPLAGDEGLGEFRYGASAISTIARTARGGGCAEQHRRGSGGAR